MYGLFYKLVNPQSLLAFQADRHNLFKHIRMFSMSQTPQNRHYNIGLHNYSMYRFTNTFSEQLLLHSTVQHLARLLLNFELEHGSNITNGYDFTESQHK